MKYAVIRKPAGALSTLNEFDRIFNNFRLDFPGSSSVNSFRTPRVDIVEHESEYLLEAELPGFSEKDIAVNIEKHVLSITSTREEESQGNHDRYLLRERRSDKVSRSFVLPKEVDEGAISAEFRNGILKLTIPKLPKEQPKTIEVKLAS